MDELRGGYCRSRWEDEGNVSIAVIDGVSIAVIDVVVDGVSIAVIDVVDVTFTSFISCFITALLLLILTVLLPRPLLVSSPSSFTVFISVSRATRDVSLRARAGIRIGIMEKITCAQASTSSNLRFTK